MSYDSDYLYALELQKRLDAGDDDFEEVNKLTKKPLEVKRSNPHSNLDAEFLNRTQNLVHPQWETLDPTPDVFALFNQFDDKFFQSRLKCVTLEWSKRMYSCAGICYSRRNRLGMDITIRLSEPLLKLRSRKDLVETMLHEMIHAYCFVLHIREANGGHGPNFKKIMYAINKVAGTNITVYHTFNDEVNVYKQHWWRCNGICQDRSPFFGYVKRSSNRAPGPNDFWWAKHLQECGGTFMKIKEPEKKRGAKSTKLTNKENKQRHKTEGNSDLHKFFKPQSKSNTTQANNKITALNDLNKKPNDGALKSNGSGTLLVNSKTTSSSSAGNPSSTIAQLFPPSSYPGLSTNPLHVSKTSGSVNRSNAVLGAVGAHFSNVVGFKNMENNASALRKTSSLITWGKGNSLSSSSESNKLCTNDGIDPQHLRRARLKRFSRNPSSSPNVEKRKPDDNEDNLTENAKRKRALSPSHTITSSDDVYVLDDSVAEITGNWIKVDDDIMLREPEEEIINLLSGDESNEDDYEYTAPKSTINKNMTIDERQTVIKREILDESIDLCDDDIELIDGEFDDTIVDNCENKAAAELTDSSIIDEFFGEDTLLKEYHLENQVDARNFKYFSNPESDIITCPICQSKMSRGVFAEHLDGCTGIAVKIKPPKRALKKLSAISKEARPKKQPRPSKNRAKDILRQAGYTEEDLADLSNMEEEDEVSVLDASTSSQRTSADGVIHLSSSPDDENTRRYRLRSIYKSTRQCPRCGSEIEETEMVEHMHECRSK